MRIGELRHLTWKDIDFAKAVILIRPKEFSNPQTGEKEFWKPKTGMLRAIPMTAAARQLLDRMRRRGPWVFTDCSCVCAGRRNSPSDPKTAKVFARRPQTTGAQRTLAHLPAQFHFKRIDAGDTRGDRAGMGRPY